MTSSETPTDDDDDGELPAVARERAATAAEPDAAAKRPADPDFRIRVVVLAASVAAGWGFILWAHNFRWAAPVAFLWIGWFAVVSGVYYLWRTGTATADTTDEDAAWWRPTGAREELEREKRSLLKAIKEVEFDQQTGKMNEKDALAIARVYRARAIEVIRAIDEVEAGGTRSVRQQIERELKARLAIESQAKKAVEKQKKHKDKVKAQGKAAAKPAPAPAPAKPASEDKPAKAAKPATPEPDPETEREDEPADAAADAAAPPAEAKPAVETTEAS